MCWTTAQIAAMSTVTGHPITVAAERSGLSQDVLRVWERRYGAVRPSRGPGGQRVYSDADVARLRLLHAVTRAGRSISSVAGLATSELERLAAEDAAAREPESGTAPQPEMKRVVDECVGLARGLATHELDIELRRALARYGLVAFLDGVAAPLLRRLGDEWHSGQLSPAQEHHATSVLQDVILETVRRFTPGANAPRIVVSTLPGERHALGAAMVAATAAAEGWRVTYLGADLPVDDIALAAQSAAADVLALSIVYVEERRRTARELDRLRSVVAAKIDIVLGGAGASVIDVPQGVMAYGSVEQLRAALQTGKRQRASF
jgi:DNA-binding transcriptional MerR regulator/methylmalonyl-CoA mutase cobalamin-binding subunit